MKKCPFCNEEIQDGAIKCRHCKERLTDDTQNLEAVLNAPGAQLVSNITEDNNYDIQKKEERYKGIKEWSWLSLLIAYLKFIVPFGTLLTLGQTYLTLSDLKKVSEADVVSAFKYLFILYFIFDMALAVFSFRAGKKLKEIASDAIDYAKAYFLTYLAFAIISIPFMIVGTKIIYGIYNVEHSVYKLELPQMVGQIVKALIIFTICYLFLNKSKRVKATYH